MTKTFFYEGPPTFLTVDETGSGTRLTYRQCWPQRLVELPESMPWVDRWSQGQDGEQRLKTSTIVLPPRLEMPVDNIEIDAGAPVNLQVINNGGVEGVIYNTAGLPAGWSINQFGRIIGTAPTTRGAYQFSVTATNDGGSSSVTFNVEILPLPSNTPLAALTHNFRTLNALPAGWETQGATLTFDADGVTLPGGSSSWLDRYIVSPEFIPQDNQEIVIDFQGSGSIVVGLSEPGLWGDFSQLGSYVWGGNLHNGRKPVLLAEDTGFLGNVASRIKFVFHSGASSVEISLYSNGALTRELSLGVQPNMADGTRIYVGVLGGTIILSETTATIGDDDYLMQAQIPTEFIRTNSNLIPFSGLDESFDMATMRTRVNQAGVFWHRFPGGDTSTYYDPNAFGSNIGGLIGDPAPNGNADPAADGRRDAPGVNRTPDPMPLGLQFNLQKQYALADLVRLAAGKKVVWVINCVTSGLDIQVQFAKDAIAAGLNISAFEYGNEHYFEIDNYIYSTAVGETSAVVLPQLDGESDSDYYFRQLYSDLNHYFERANRWIDRFNTEFPSIPVWLTGDSTTAGHGPRGDNWNQYAYLNGTFDRVAGHTNHPYYKTTDIGVQKTDVGNEARAGAIAVAGIQRFREIIAGAGDWLPKGKTISYTELNILDDPAQTVFTVLGQTWLHALMLDIQIHILLKDPRSDGMFLHMLMGNAQWGMIYNEAGTAINPAKRGVDDVPFEDGIATPLALTMTGHVLSMTSALINGGTGQLLVDEIGSAFIAWRIDNRISAINATTATKTLTLPIDGSEWQAEIHRNAGWTDTVDPADLPAPTVATYQPGEQIDILSFSKLIITRV